jgi:hypothetical protein
MEIQVEQRICLKFCYSNKIWASAALKMLETAYEDSALSRARVFDWYKSFKEGRTSVENLSHERRPATSVNDENIEKVKEIVLENRRVTEREIASELGISNGSAHTIIHDVLGMRRVCARLVPKLLNFLQK